MLEKAILTVLCVGLLLAGGCASIVTSGSERPIKVQSDPAGASVYVNDDFRGKTPLTVMVARRDEHRLRVEHEGYEPYQVDTRKGVNGWVFGNIIFGGLIGVGVDYLSGAMWVPSPGKVEVKLLELGERYSARLRDVRAGVPAENPEELSQK